MRRLVVVLLVVALAFAGTAALAVGPANNPAGQARAEAAKQAQEKANEAKQESKEAAKEAATIAREADQAAREADRLATQNPTAAEAAKQQANAKADEARKAAAEAKEKAQEAGKAYREAALARAVEKSNGKAVRALTKVQAAADPCLDYLVNPTPELAGECKTDRYLVRFTNGVDATSQVKSFRNSKLKVNRVFEGVISGATMELSAKQLATIANNGVVTSIEEDTAVSVEQTQLNPDWGLDRIDQSALPLSASYTNANQGAGVKIYIVDTGIRSTHQEFTGRVIAGYTAISDGRGTLDCNGHGTHVAGTAAGTTYGVAKAATLVPVRVLGCQGEGLISGVLSGLDWIATNHKAGEPAVVNMSLGGMASSTLDSAVQSLVNRGITVVVAAGNSSADACSYSPARVASAITVAASSRTDGFASFSNFGSCVDLVAPGVDITSSVISSDTAVAVYSGTSMASPHVAGAAASLMSAGYLTPAEVSYSLSQATAAAISSVPASTTNRLLQITSAGGGSGTTPTLPPSDATAPISPVITGVSLSRNAADVSWQISADGGSPILAHSVRVWERGRLAKTVDVSASASSARVTGLKWGVAYTFTVVATNAIGTSADSITSDSVTPTRR